MSKVAVRIKDWPFQKGDKAKLIWMGEPFKQNNKWMFYAYFKGNKLTKKILLDWASVHFLSADKYYIDGNLNNGEVLESEDTIDINLTGVRAEYIEKNWEIWGTGFKDKTKSKTFNFSKNGELYTVPIVEIIRAVLAPDRFMLNRIVEMDTLENYFIHEIKDDKLYIYFNSQYEKNLLKSEKINHIAWILTNSKVFKMFNSIGQNMWQIGELKFDYLLNSFNIRARVNKSGRYIRVLEIISLKKKRINANEITVYHPSLGESKTTNETKKRKYISNNKNDGDNRELNSEMDGSTMGSEEINTFLISHEYERVPKINRIKSGKKNRRIKEDENTKTFVVENAQLRTTADIGGEKLLTGLEFTSITNVQEKGELEEFIEILKLLEKRHTVKSVEIIIGGLPEGIKGKRFSKLSDGVTKRKYAIGKINMMDGRECSLIEIERENKSLSMLILKAINNVKWNWIYSKLLFQLVEESGKWNNEVINTIRNQGIVVYRSKHIKKNIYKKVEHIYYNLFI